MSASLVGSEMCIRDRTTGGRFCASQRPTGGGGHTPSDHLLAMGMAPSPREEAVDGLRFLHSELLAPRERPGEGGIQA
eukprot:6242479-Alexandrium_andersonii.AAC.1